MVLGALSALVASFLLALDRPLVGVPALVAVALGCWYLMRYAARQERAARVAELQRLRAIAAPVGQAWRKLLQAEGLGAHVEPLASLTRMAVRLATRPCEELALGQSRIGGTPDLPADFEWPSYRGEPQAFIAQLDLAEIHRVLPDSPLPPAGSLWFFYSPGAGYSPEHAGCNAVVFREAGTKLVRTPAPAGIAKHWVYRACSIEAEAYEDIPDLGEDNRLGNRVLDEWEIETYYAMRIYLSSAGEWGAHKLLGHSEPVQDAMELEVQLAANGIETGLFRRADPRVKELEAKKHEWRLLLQVESDPNAGMMWGDAGRLYFWIRDEDLRERRFERCWAIMQST